MGIPANWAPVIEQTTQDPDAPLPPAPASRQDLGRAVAALGRRTLEVAIEGRGRITAQAIGERLEQVVAVPIGPIFIRRQGVQESLESIADQGAVRILDAR